MACMMIEEKWKQRAKGLTEEAFGSHSTSFSYNLKALLPASLNHSISTQQHFSLLELHSHLPLDLLRDNLLLRISTHS